MERWIVLSLISSASKIILLYRGMPKPPKASKYDLMLTPQFYIVKDEEIPVKYAFQAKKLAPSILDDLLESNKEYEFIVEKLENGWRFYAYSPKEIEDFLDLYEIKPNQIGKIYFAEQIGDILEKVPLSLDEEHALGLLDSKATIIPKSMLDSAVFANFNEKMRPKKAFKFKRFSINKKSSDTLDATTITVAVLMLLLAGAFIIQALDYKKATKELEDKLLALYEEAPSLRTKLSRDAIRKKYEEIETRQRSIREQLKNFSQLSSKKSILEKLTLNENNLEAVFKVEPSEIKRIKAITANTSLSYKDSGNGVLTIQGALK